MAIVSVAIVSSFHLRNQPTKLERRVALPLGLIFWVSALACLAAGFANYIKAVTKYSRRTALVQSGWKTQAVFTLVAIALITSCLILLSTSAQQHS
ncbi:MAG: replication factor A protein 2 [Watsoniomyces obsoletus]|nr:MAG: replication factor A protein 2 [Watsoniomyces obsoletus]